MAALTQYHANLCSICQWFGGIIVETAAICGEFDHVDLSEVAEERATHKNVALIVKRKSKFHEKAHIHYGYMVSKEWIEQKKIIYSYY